MPQKDERKNTIFIKAQSLCFETACINEVLLTCGWNFLTALEIITAVHGNEDNDIVGDDIMVRMVGTTITIS